MIMKKITSLLLIILCLALSNIVTAQNLFAVYVGKSNSGKITQERTDVQEMDFSNKGMNALPSGLFAMTSLKQLDLSNNKLTELPCEIKNLKTLTVLKLNGNKIYELPAEISRLKFLKEIYLSREIWQYRLDEIKKQTSARIILVD